MSIRHIPPPLRETVDGQPERHSALRRFVQISFLATASWALFLVLLYAVWKLFVLLVGRGFSWTI